MPERNEFIPLDESLSQREEMEKQQKRLKAWHWALFVIHLIAAILLAVLIQTQSSPIPLDVRQHQIEVDVTSSEGYRWTSKSIGGVNPTALIAIFFGVTAGAHLYYATDVFGSGMYSRHVFNEQMNPSRWVEYAFSATVMILLIAVVSGVKDFDTILLVCLGTGVIMLQGFIVEAQMAKGKKEGQNAVTLTATVSGWALLTLIFLIILTNFGRRLTELQTIGYNLPSWLQYVSIPMLAWFSSFGFVQLVQIFKGGAFFKYEYAYTILSAASKLFLGIWMTVGLIQSQNNNAITSSVPSTSSSSNASTSNTQVSVTV